MPHYKCRCLFIPPHVLDKMAKKGMGNARITIQQSQRSRAIRSAKKIPMAIFTETKVVGEGSRRVYDCNHTWMQRVDDPVRSEGEGATGDQAADTVFDFIGKVREYFKSLGRNSYDNLGEDIISNVHFGVDYNNAFWDGDELTFGDGDGKIFISFANSLDVVAHEFAHGVTQFT
jgi:Zn-dependent metalloprotease